MQWLTYLLRVIKSLLLPSTGTFFEYVRYSPLDLDSGEGISLLDCKKESLFEKRAERGTSESFGSLNVKKLNTGLQGLILPFLRDRFGV